MNISVITIDQISIGINIQFIGMKWRNSSKLMFHLIIREYRIRNDRINYKIQNRTALINIFIVYIVAIL